jgi:hypothetical protein
MKILSLTAIFLMSAFHLAGQVEDFKHINFYKADSIALLFPKHSLKNLKLLADNLTHSLSTDAEKFRAIYYWVCANISYDYKLFQMNQRQREKLKDPQSLEQWYRRINALMFAALLKKHRTICTGYAYLIRELARQAGLPCEIIDGYGRNSLSNVGGPGIPSHQWNAVQLNKKWYLCDATWSSGFLLRQGGYYIRDYNDSYFLLDPALFVRNHYPIDTTWVLLSKKPTLQEFLNGPLVYSKLIDLKTTQLYPETFEVETIKKVSMHFQFNAELPFLENVAVSINGQLGIPYPILKPDESGLYTLGHRFDSRGTYLVHVSQNKQYLFSYKVTVR